MINAEKAPLTFWQFASFGIYQNRDRPITKSAYPWLKECNFGRCRVCRKENKHFSSACPYWNGVPPGAIVGDGYGVVCGLFDRRLYKNTNRCAHPGGSSKGRLIVAHCNYCRNSGLHWSEKCPERPKDKPYKLLFISSSKPKLLKKTY
ncbi:hypothetical protein D8674_041229 [Pyrus ussuriensis x Pyrus communis]|uniref:Uncharacterized protein n=1 Tax=Pyrus ussuriensis x Pyrus communis TaxID=2448454 RepID=A0A5N5GZK1_9ROSA|nr:hypothetical protein D8674_041229 [Pyrus ussuriensis x Pyrus communis]